jgi:hypothetical protein
MEEFFLNEIFLYLALACVCVAFLLWIRSVKRRKKELEGRRSLSKKIREKFRRKNGNNTPEMNIGE